MESRFARKVGVLGAATLAALAATGCAGNRDAVSDRSGTEEERRASDTLFIDGTGEVPGGMGGAGDIAPMDPIATDTAGIHGDPNAWPTGPLPSDTGMGGAGTPMPDPAREEDSFKRDSSEADGPGGDAGPDLW